MATASYAARHLAVQRHVNRAGLGLRVIRSGEPLELTYAGGGPAVDERGSARPSIEWIEDHTRIVRAVDRTESIPIKILPRWRPTHRAALRRHHLPGGRIDLRGGRAGTGAARPWPGLRRTRWIFRRSGFSLASAAIRRSAGSAQCWKSRGSKSVTRWATSASKRSTTTHLWSRASTPSPWKRAPSTRPESMIGGAPATAIATSGSSSTAACVATGARRSGW